MRDAHWDDFDNRGDSVRTPGNHHPRPPARDARGEAYLEVLRMIVDLVDPENQDALLDAVDRLVRLERSAK